MRGSFFMSRFPTLAGDFPLLAFIHGSKPALTDLAATIAFSLIRLHIRLLKANLNFSRRQPV